MGTLYHYRDAAAVNKTNYSFMTLCGSEEMRGYFASEPYQISCPKCSAAYFAPLVPHNVQVYRAGAEHGGKHAGARSIYCVAIDGEVRAFVSSQAGWGKGWRVWGTRYEPEKSEINVRVGYVLERGNRYTTEIAVWSKEAAVCLALLDIAWGNTGAYFSLAERKLQEVEYKERQKRREERERIENAQRAEYKASIREGLEDTLRRNDLTEKQRESVTAALELWNTPEHDR